VELSQYVLEVLRRDEEFVLYRGEPPNEPCSPSVLLLAPASLRPTPEALKKIEHEYSLRDELDSAWAVRSLALSKHRGQMALVLEDPGGEILDRFLPGPMEMTRFLHFAVGIATALSRLHEKGLIHKNVRPANVLVNPATEETWRTRRIPDRSKQQRIGKLFVAVHLQISRNGVFVLIGGQNRWLTEILRGSSQPSRTSM